MLLVRDGVNREPHHQDYATDACQQLADEADAYGRCEGQRRDGGKGADDEPVPETDEDPSVEDEK